MLAGAAADRRPARAPLTERDPFFIIGRGRSGSTLLQAMLMSHPRIAIGPETYFFGRTDPVRTGHDLRTDAGLGAYLDAACRDWRARGLEFDEAALRRDIAESRRSAAEVFTLLVQQTAGVRSRRVRLGEKTARHYRFVDRIREAFPAAQFIHVRRDPRDVCLSYRDLKLGGHASVLFYARDWAKAEREHRRIMRELPPEACTSVRYEDLATSPERELRRLCAFLGEAFDDAMLRFHERAATGIEAGAHWKAMTLTPLTTSRIGRYRAALSMREIRTVERVAGPLLTELGYEPEPGPPDRLSWRLMSAAEYGLTRLRNNVRRAGGGRAAARGR